MTDDAAGEGRAELERRVAERLAAKMTAWSDDAAEEHNAAWLAVAREALRLASLAWDASASKHIGDARTVHNLNHDECHECGMVQWEASTHYLSAAIEEDVT